LRTAAGCVARGASACIVGPCARMRPRRGCTRRKTAPWQMPRAVSRSLLSRRVVLSLRSRLLCCMWSQSSRRVVLRSWWLLTRRATRLQKRRSVEKKEKKTYDSLYEDLPNAYASADLPEPLFHRMYVDELSNADKMVGADDAVGAAARGAATRRVRVQGRSEARACKRRHASLSPWSVVGPGGPSREKAAVSVGKEGRMRRLGCKRGSGQKKRKKEKVAGGGRENVTNGAFLKSP
jgi:hypothetical protein